MSKYLDTRGRGDLAIAICPRCKFKVPHASLQMDPNNQQMYCPKCVDIYDPYRLPPRAPDQFTIQYPRPDEELVLGGIDPVVLEDGSFWVTDEGDFVVIDDDQIAV